MTDDERHHELMRSGLRPMPPDAPSRDLWPSILARSQAPPRWSWVDLSLAAAVGLALLVYPEWLWLLAYHL